MDKNSAKNSQNGTIKNKLIKTSVTAATVAEIVLFCNITMLLISWQGSYNRSMNIN